MLYETAVIVSWYKMMFYVQNHCPLHKESFLPNTMQTGFISCAGGDQKLRTARCTYVLHPENALRANLGRSMCAQTIIDPITSAQFTVKNEVLHYAPGALHYTGYLKLTSKRSFNNWDDTMPQGCNLVHHFLQC